jgi:hypothetical protein
MGPLPCWPQPTGLAVIPVQSVLLGLDVSVNRGGDHVVCAARLVLVNQRRPFAVMTNA